ncbi:MAG: HupE/UreJ family protein [Reichenbachiella sp.]
MKRMIRYDVFCVGLVLSCLALSLQVKAHEIRPALLSIVERDSGLFDVTWKVPAVGDMVLGLKPKLPASLEPIGPSTHNKLPGTIIEYATYQLKGKSMAGESILIEGLSTVQIDVLVKMEFLDGTVYSSLLQPKSPEYLVPSPGTKATISWSYWRMGIEHILSGIDHLLFVLALLLLIPNYWKLLKTITAFTLAHSITLGLATLGFVQVPPAPTEAIIAMSIVFLAVELIHVKRGQSSVSAQYPWSVAMIFGLFHGLGFAGALTQVGLPAQEIPLALLMFNVGVETGQIMFVLVVLVVLAINEKIKIPWPDWSWKILPYAIGSIGAFWTIQRAISFL